MQAASAKLASLRAPAASVRSAASGGRSSSIRSGSPTPRPLAPRPSKRRSFLNTILDPLGKKKPPEPGTVTNRVHHLPLSGPVHSSARELLSQKVEELLDLESSFAAENLQCLLSVEGRSWPIPDEDRAKAITYLRDLTMGTGHEDIPAHPLPTYEGHPEHDREFLQSTSKLLRAVMEFLRSSEGGRGLGFTLQTLARLLGSLTSEDDSSFAEELQAPMRRARYYRHALQWTTRMLDHLRKAPKISLRAPSFLRSPSSESSMDPPHLTMKSAAKLLRTPTHRTPASPSSWQIALQSVMEDVAALSKKVEDAIAFADPAEAENYRRLVDLETSWNTGEVQALDQKGKMPILLNLTGPSTLPPTGAGAPPMILHSGTFSRLEAFWPSPDSPQAYRLEGHVQLVVLSDCVLVAEVDPLSAPKGMYPPLGPASLDVKGFARAEGRNPFDLFIVSTTVKTPCIRLDAGDERRKARVLEAIEKTGIKVAGAKATEPQWPSSVFGTLPHSQAPSSAPNSNLASPTAGKEDPDIILREEQAFKSAFFRKADGKWTMSVDLRVQLRLSVSTGNPYLLLTFINTRRVAYRAAVGPDFSWTTAPGKSKDVKTLRFLAEQVVVGEPMLVMLWFKSGFRALEPTYEAALTTDPDDKPATEERELIEKLHLQAASTGSASAGHRSLSEAPRVHPADSIVAALEEAKRQAASKRLQECTYVEAMPAGSSPAMSFSGSCYVESPKMALGAAALTIVADTLGKAVGVQLVSDVTGETVVCARLAGDKAKGASISVNQNGKVVEVTLPDSSGKDLRFSVSASLEELAAVGTVLARPSAASKPLPPLPATDIAPPSGAVESDVEDASCLPTRDGEPVFLPDDSEYDDSEEEADEHETLNLEASMTLAPSEPSPREARVSRESAIRQLLDAKPTSAGAPAAAPAGPRPHSFPEASRQAALPTAVRVDPRPPPEKLLSRAEQRTGSSDTLISGLPPITAPVIDAGRDRVGALNRRVFDLEDSLRASEGRLDKERKARADAERELEKYKAQYLEMRDMFWNLDDRYQALLADYKKLAQEDLADYSYSGR